MACDSQAPVDVDKPLEWIREKPLFWAVRLVLGAVFILAGLDKILNPIGFAKNIDNYQILPDSLVNLAAVTLPWIELMLGSFLVAGIWLPGTIALVNLLLATFFIALVFNVARGLNVDCGCFSQSRVENPSTFWYFLRDGFFLLIGGYLFYGTFFEPSQLPRDKGAPEKICRV